jgi:hypothetical protein
VSHSSNVIAIEVVIVPESNQVHKFIFYPIAKDSHGVFLQRLYGTDSRTHFLNGLNDVPSGFRVGAMTVIDPCDSDMNQTASLIKRLTSHGRKNDITVTSVISPKTTKECVYDLRFARII